MDGVRVTESGRGRLTEAGDRRITERLVSASADLYAIGSELTAALRVIYGLVSISGAGSISADADVETAPIGADLIAAATIDVQGLLTFHAAADLEAVGSEISAAGFTKLVGADLVSISAISASGIRTAHGASAATGYGDMSAGAELIHNGAASLTATGSISAVGGFTYISTADLGAIDRVRVTEAGNRRVTEDGRVRQSTENTSFLLADGTLIEFSGGSFTNVNGDWFPIIPIVRASDEWVVPIKAYAHAGGNWSRFL